jgi:hypothetical protein
VRATLLRTSQRLSARRAYASSLTS